MRAPTPMEHIVDTLRKRGVIAADAPSMPEEGEPRPWFVAMMLGIAGWLAGILLLAFIGMNFRLESRAAFAIVGLALMVGAWALYYADRKAVFLDQLALALSIAGQCALAWALLKNVDSGFTWASTLARMVSYNSRRPPRCCTTWAGSMTALSSATRAS